MGYEFHITRREDWFEESGPEITKAEWLAFVAGDPDWKIAGYNGDCFAFWLRSGQPEGYGPWIDWRDGNLHSTRPPAPMILEMIRIAKHFGARVQGDEGEFYETEADIAKYFG